MLFTVPSPFGIFTNISLLLFARSIVFHFNGRVENMESDDRV